MGKVWTNFVVSRWFSDWNCFTQWVLSSSVLALTLFLVNKYKTGCVDFYIREHNRYTSCRNNNVWYCSMACFRKLSITALHKINLKHADINLTFYLSFGVGFNQWLRVLLDQSLLFFVFVYLMSIWWSKSFQTDLYCLFLFYYLHCLMIKSWCLGNMFIPNAFYFFFSLFNSFTSCHDGASWFFSRSKAVQCRTDIYIIAI